jgi:hypothetical protein
VIGEHGIERAQRRLIDLAGVPDRLARLECLDRDDRRIVERAGPRDRLPGIGERGLDTADGEAAHTLLECGGTGGDLLERGIAHEARRLEDLCTDLVVRLHRLVVVVIVVMIVAAFELRGQRLLARCAGHVRPPERILDETGRRSRDARRMQRAVGFTATGRAT